VCSRRRTGATGFVAPRAGSTAHRRTASEAVLVGDAHPTNTYQGIFEIDSIGHRSPPEFEAMAAVA